jgi:hypothetical protein
MSKLPTLLGTSGTLGTLWVVKVLQRSQLTTEEGTRGTD